MLNLSRKQFFDYRNSTLTKAYKFSRCPSPSRVLQDECCSTPLNPPIPVLTPVFHWLISLKQADIKHKLNQYYGARFRKYSMNGWDAMTNTIYQFQRCYHYSHDCRLTQNIKGKKWLKTKDEMKRKTRGPTDYLKSQGHNVIKMWECEIKDYCKRRTRMYWFINSRQPGFLEKYRGEITMPRILKEWFADKPRERMDESLADIDCHVPSEMVSRSRNKSQQDWPRLTKWLEIQSTACFKSCVWIESATLIMFTDIAPSLQI